MDDLTTRFMTAFNGIESHFRNDQQSDHYKTFGELIATELKKGSISKGRKSFLMDAAHLRNFIVHEYGNDIISAIPSEQTVHSLEKFHLMLTNPPKLIPAFSKHVASCTYSDTVGHATRIMRENLYSQLPVLDDNGGIVDLLTTHTIALWLAECFIHHDDLAENLPVREILKHREENHVYLFTDRNTTVFQAMCKIEKTTSIGNIFQAMLITERGKKSEKPLGIITAFDIPKLNSEIG